METPPLTAALESLPISVEGLQRLQITGRHPGAAESPALAVNSCDQRPSRPPATRAVRRGPGSLDTTR
jgi:hypothetical protein